MDSPDAAQPGSSPVPGSVERLVSDEHPKITRRHMRGSQDIPATLNTNAETEPIR
jgi:hypothetical protein